MRGRQRRWDELLTQKTHEDLLEVATDSITRARLLSTASKESGAWLNVLPIPHLGTKLDDDSIRIATGLHIGADIVMEHTCVCGASVDRKGTHGLSCRKTGGRISRHHAANETLRQALVSGGVPSILEPVGVCREDAKRPDGMTLVPWESGRVLLWDFTCWDTLAPSNRLTASTGPGVLACSAEQFKQRKYSSLTSMFIFAPVCIESLGAWGESAKKFVHQVGARVRETTGEVRATSFLIQRLAIDVQRGNAASVMATIPATKDWGDVGRLLIIFSYCCCLLYFIVFFCLFVVVFLRMYVLFLLLLLFAVFYCLFCLFVVVFCVCIVLFLFLHMYILFLFLRTFNYCAACSTVV